MNVHKIIIKNGVREITLNETCDPLNITCKTALFKPGQSPQRPLILNQPNQHFADHLKSKVFFQNLSGQFVLNRGLTRTQAH